MREVGFWHSRDFLLVEFFHDANSNGDCKSNPNHQQVAQRDNEHGFSSGLRQDLPTQRAPIMRRITNSIIYYIIVIANIYFLDRRTPDITPSFSQCLPRIARELFILVFDHDQFLLAHMFQI